MRFLSGVYHLTSERIRSRSTLAGVSPRSGGRLRQVSLRAAVSAVLVMPVLFIGPATPASAAPTVKQLQDKIAKLGDQIEVESQAYSATLDKIDSLNVTAKAATARAAVASVQVGKARQQLGIIAGELYRGGDLATLQLVLGTDPKNLLAQNGLATSLADRRAQTIKSYTAAQQNLAAAKSDYNTKMAELKALDAKQKARLAQLKSDSAAATAAYKSLTAPQQRRFSASRDTTRAGMTCAQAGVTIPSGSAGRAVAYACNHIGYPYSWGGTGPRVFDCSGLTQAAWRAAGVSLDRTANDQYIQQRGHTVSLANVQPGDLLLYRPSGSGYQHIAMYVGNGYAIHAPQHNDVVRLFLLANRTPSKIVRV